MIQAASKRNASFIATDVAEFLLGELETIDLGPCRLDKVVAMRVGLFHRQPSTPRRWSGDGLAPGGGLFVQYDEP